MSETRANSKFRKIFMFSLIILTGLIGIFFYFLSKNNSKKFSTENVVVCGKFYPNLTKSNMHSNYIKNKLTSLSKFKNYEQDKKQLINFFPKGGTLEDIVNLLYQEGIDYFRSSCLKDRYVTINVSHINKHLIGFPCESTGVLLSIKFDFGKLTAVRVYQVNKCL